MQLTGDLQAMRYIAVRTSVSATTRAYAGPVFTLRSLWAGP